MNPSEYAVEVNRTRRRTDAQLPDETYLIGHTLGLVGESGEVCDLVKKHVLHGHALDREKLIKELGDALWYNIALRLDCRRPAPRNWPLPLPEDHTDPKSLAMAALDLASHANEAAVWTDGLSEADEPLEYRDHKSATPWLNGHLKLIATLASVCGVDLAHVAEQNIAKLRARFPEGFTAAASQARVDVEQHTVLPVAVPTSEPEPKEPTRLPPNFFRAIGREFP